MLKKKRNAKNSTKKLAVRKFMLKKATIHFGATSLIENKLVLVSPTSLLVT